MISLIKKRIKDIKQYTHDIQLKKYLWIWVAIDYTISHFLYKFTAEDYFTKVSQVMAHLHNLT